jgi:hypothetical protein
MMQRRGFRSGIDTIARFFDVSDHTSSSANAKAESLKAAPYQQPWLAANFCPLWLRPSLRWAATTVPAYFTDLVKLAADPNVHAVGSRQGGYFTCFRPTG